jgi:hypothetical protein
VDRERLTTSRAAGSANRLKGIETRTAAMGMGTRRQLTAKGAERGVDGIENSSGKTFQVHAEEYANSLPFEEFSMPEQGCRGEGGLGRKILARNDTESVPHAPTLRRSHSPSHQK